MIEAPQVDDRVLVAGHTVPPILATVESVVGYEQRNDGAEWVVGLNVDCQPDVGPTSVEIGAQFHGHVVLRRHNMDVAKWELVDPSRPQPATRHDTRLEEASRLAAQLVDVVRWALGEIGEFPEPPVVEPKNRLKRLYWWRGELRQRAINAGAQFSVLPHNSEGK